MTRNDKKDTDVFWGEMAPCDHVVQVYEGTDEFIQLLESFVTSGLDAGESVILIVTKDHARSINSRLNERGYDRFNLILEDRLIILDARETLSQFIINDWPDENLFYHLVMTLLLRARSKERKVRAFGEMVALLWAQGKAGATVHLEHLWTRFCNTEQFKLFCAYPKSGFTSDSMESLASICSCHNKIVSKNDHGVALVSSVN